MKTRAGYVSNSSSSSFLVAYNGLDAFDFMAGREGYGVFVNDLKRENARKGTVLLDFFEEEYCRVMYEYLHYLYDRNSRWYIESRDPSEKFINECQKMGCEIDASLDGIIMEGILHVREKAEQNRYLNSSLMNDLSVKFAKAICRSARKKWKFLSVLSYGDDDAFGAYMENKFMSMVEMNVDEGKSAVISRNEH